jgi:hypothetical protein
MEAMFCHGDFTVRKVLKNKPLVEAIFDSATTTYINPQKVMDEIESLFIAGREEFFEDGMESRFSKGLISAIEKYDDLAIDAISDLIPFSVRNETYSF